MIRAVFLAGAIGAATLFNAHSAPAQEVQAIPSAGLDQTAPEIFGVLDAIGLYEILAIMANENARGAADLEAELFPGQGGAAWVAMSTHIHSADRIVDIFEGAFPTDGFTPEHIDELSAFFSSEAGQRIVEGEISARLEFLDEDLETAANETFMEAIHAGDERLLLLERFNEVNDLVDRNVAGALNASFAFYQGLADGGAFDMDMPDDLMLTEVWNQEEEVRRSTVEWLYSYQLTAYADATDADLEAYVALSESEAGQALNAALFLAFEEVFNQLSYELGTAAAVFIAGEDT